MATSDYRKSREDIVAAVARTLAEIYFDDVCKEPRTAQDLLETAQRMKAIREAILTARDLFGIMDAAAEIGAEPTEETGVVVLPEVLDSE